MLQATPQRLYFLKFNVVHDSIQLAANLVVQLGDMVVNQGLVELFHFLAGLTQTLQEHLYTRSNTLIGIGFRHRGFILPARQVTQTGSGFQIDFFKQGGINPFGSGTFPDQRLTRRYSRFILYRHQHFP
ncbi:hypothetical protein D3C76_1080430 [compost metagenome]